MKKQRNFKTGKWACLIGNGPVAPNDLAQIAQGAAVYCADGGANVAIGAGLSPVAVYGDGDSIDATVRARLGSRLSIVADEDTTDFEKCLSNMKEAHLLCLGFLGGRLDHQLAALSTLAKFPTQRAVLVGADDIALLAVSDLEIELPVGSDVALFPLGPARLNSDGLVWETGGIAFDPVGMLGTSNKMAKDRLCLRDVDGSMILILPRAALGAVCAAIDLWAGHHEHEART